LYTTYILLIKRQQAPVSRATANIGHHIFVFVNCFYFTMLLLHS